MWPTNLLWFGMLAVAASSLGQTTPGGALLVVSKMDHALAVVDPSSMKVVARVPVGNDPHEVVASTDGKTAYVSNYGAGTYNTLTPVDLVKQKEMQQVDLGLLRGPHGLQFLDGKVWFTAEGAKVVGRYDPAANKVDWVLGTGQNKTHMIFVRADEEVIVTANSNSGTMSIMEIKPLPAFGPPGGLPADVRLRMQRMGMPKGPTSDWTGALVSVGNGPEGFDVSPDGKEIWVANAQDGTVSIIDLNTKQVTLTLAVDVKSANRLKFTPDGMRVLISSIGGPDVVVLDVASRKLIKRIPVGHGSAGVLMQPDGARAFVACSPDDYVAVIDLKSLNVVGRIDAGGEPDGLAWAARSENRVNR